METVELKEIGRILRKRLWLIVLLAAVAVALSGIYGFMMMKPIYQASTKLIVNQSIDNGALPPQMNQSMISANIMLIETYKEIIRTNAIMDRVEERYPELNITAEQLMSRVQVSSVNDTQVMTVYAQDASYERAVDIVNAVATVFKDTIPTIMKIDNVEILSPAKLANVPSPVNVNPMSYIVVSLVLALMIGGGLAFLMEHFDDSIRNEADVPALLGVPAYAVIANMKSKDLIPRNRVTNKSNLGEVPYATLEQ